MKRLLFGLIAMLLVACSASASPPDESAEEAVKPPDPTAADPVEAVEPTEPDPATEAPTAQPTEEAVIPTVSEAPESESLPVIRPAPELQNEVWLNTDQPLRLADLRGQVVLLDMWTFG